MNQKSDIFIKYKKYVKCISIKSGQSNSIHTESIQEFKRYLEKLNIPYKIINKYILDMVPKIDDEEVQQYLKSINNTTSKIISTVAKNSISSSVISSLNAA